MKQPAVRVLLVDDYNSWRRFAFSILQKMPELRVIGEVSDGWEAVAEGRYQARSESGCRSWALSMNGIEVARRIREISPGPKILFGSESRSVDVAEAALTAGAVGYVVKSDTARELFPATRAVLEGKRFISACLAGHFLVATTSSTTQTMLSWMVMLASGIR